jgi:hypothetical protein
MPDLTAKRTLVKSPPELWEELSEVEGLTKHFGAFGEIKITKLEPEHTVAWEGERGSGTVSIEPSGWGTKVTLHAELPEAETEEPEAETELPEAETEEAAKPEPDVTEPEAVVADPAPVVTEPVLVEAVSLPEHDPTPKRRGFWAWLFRPRTEAHATEPTPPTPSAPGSPLSSEPAARTPEPEPVATEREPVLTEPASAVTEPEPDVIEPQAERIEADPVNVDAEEEVEPVEAEAEAVEAEAVEAGEPEDESAWLDPERARVVLDEALNALGAAHHRPFSRG